MSKYSKYSNGYFAPHQNPEVVDFQTALQLARRLGGGKVIADYYWDKYQKVLLVTFISNNKGEEI